MFNFMHKTTDEVVEVPDHSAEAEKAVSDTLFGSKDAEIEPTVDVGLTLAHILPIVPKCAGCNNVITEGPDEAPGTSTCRVFAGPKYRFSATANCLHATHLAIIPKKKRNKINPLKAAKRAARLGEGA